MLCLTFLCFKKNLIIWHKFFPLEIARKKTQLKCMMLDHYFILFINCSRHCAVKVAALSVAVMITWFIRTLLLASRGSRKTHSFDHVTLFSHSTYYKHYTLLAFTPQSLSRVSINQGRHNTCFMKRHWLHGWPLRRFLQFVFEHHCHPIFFSKSAGLHSVTRTSVKSTIV